MAIKTAKVGKIMIDADVLGEMSSGSLNISTASGETTSIPESWKTIVGLGSSWNLSASCYYNPDDTAQAALRTEFISGDSAIASVKMYEDATKYFDGAGVITSFAITKGVGATDTLSITIEGNGALSYN